MIYLSGRLKPETIGERHDLGVLLSYRGKGKGNAVSEKHFERTLWAADNGCFTNPDLNIDDYLKWLKSLKPYQENCLFATAPDVVGDAVKTWQRSKDVLPQIRALGYAAALVGQDGIENSPIEWSAFDALFIGGSTEWKLSSDAFSLTREALSQGKWVHMGRVNSKRRMIQARFFGCNSVDGTYLAFAPDTNLKNINGWLDFLRCQPVLNF